MALERILPKSLRHRDIRWITNYSWLPSVLQQSSWRSSSAVRA
jgi:hypothetical protein